jgi:hypothetical protein
MACLARETNSPCTGKFVREDCPIGVKNGKTGGCIFWPRSCDSCGAAFRFHRNSRCPAGYPPYPNNSALDLHQNLIIVGHNPTSAAPAGNIRFHQRQLYRGYDYEIRGDCWAERPELWSAWLRIHYRGHVSRHLCRYKSIGRDLRVREAGDEHWDHLKYPRNPECPQAEIRHYDQMQ